MGFGGWIEIERKTNTIGKLNDWTNQQQSRKESSCRANEKRILREDRKLGKDYS